MCVKQTNLLLTGAIAFAGLMQALFAFFLWRISKKQKDIALYMAIYNKSFNTLKTVGESLSKGKNIEDPTIKEVIYRGGADVEVLEYVEKRMLGKKLTKIRDEALKKYKRNSK